MKQTSDIDIEKQLLYNLKSEVTQLREKQEKRDEYKKSVKKIYKFENGKKTKHIQVPIEVQPGPGYYDTKEIDRKIQVSFGKNAQRKPLAQSTTPGPMAIQEKDSRLYPEYRQRETQSKVPLY